MPSLWIGSRGKATPRFLAERCRERHTTDIEQRRDKHEPPGPLLPKKKNDSYDDLATAIESAAQRSTASSGGWRTERGTQRERRTHGWRLRGPAGRCPARHWSPPGRFRRVERARFLPRVPRPGTNKRRPREVRASGESDRILDLGRIVHVVILGFSRCPHSGGSGVGRKASSTSSRCSKIESGPSCSASRTFTNASSRTRKSQQRCTRS